MKPTEATDLKERNLKYTKILMESLTATPEKIEKIKQEMNLNPTPKEVIHQESTLKLYRFTPVKKKLHKTPVLIIPSLILKYYVMDLITGHSLIEHLVNQGVDTYLLDWGTPDDRQGKLTFDFYIDTFMRRAVDKVRRATGCDKINLLGQCLGGTLATIFTTLHQDKVNRLALLTTPADFEESGMLSAWTDPSVLDIDKMVDSFGSVIPPKILHSCFQYLDVKATIERYKKLYNNVLDDGFLYFYQALDTWLNDQIPFPAEVFRKFIKELYQENALAKGEFLISGRPARLENITCPVLNIHAKYDHVFPQASSESLNDKTDGEVEWHVIEGGHVTIVVLFPVREQTFGIISEFLTREEKKKSRKKTVLSSKSTAKKKTTRAAKSKKAKTKAAAKK